MDADIPSSSGAPASEIIIDDGESDASPTLLAHIPRVGYVFDLRMTGHTPPTDPDDPDDDDDHPESPVRIVRIHARLEEAGSLALMRKIPIRNLRKDEALLVHSEDHWQKVAAIECEASTPFVLSFG